MIAARPDLDRSKFDERELVPDLVEEVLCAVAVPVEEWAEAWGAIAHRHRLDVRPFSAGRGAKRRLRRGR